jgi:hypothetical protein
VQALELDVLMSLDYEIRLFGDPTVSNDDTTPTIQVDLSAEVEQSFNHDVLEIDNILKLPTHETAQLDLSEVELSQRVPCVKVNPKAQVFPHFVDGWAFGNAVGIEMTSCSEENWSISDTRTLVDTPVSDTRVID